MTAHRTAARIGLIGAAPLLLAVGAAGPAAAHGAPTDPVSRVVACSAEGGQRAQSAACRAAVASGVAAFDNLRLAGVAGRDRQVVPDGKLCSGGLAAYRGLDLARADWPSTRLTAGADLTLTYRSTIPHTGTFKLFLTKDGYDPTKPLTWSDLPSRPFATATDPALVNGAYRISAKLPSDRTGRHLLYTIWQNTSTPDTYYSCSDVVFPGAKDNARSAASAGSAARGRAESPAKSATPETTPTRASSKSPADVASTSAQPSRTPTGAPGEAVSSPASDKDDRAPALPLIAGGAAGLLITAGAAYTLRRRR
ncbi:putative carbohydrate-binding protein with CBM5 and CBM33 domain [Streptomyces aurantiacus]|uniref:lytic polysaccharide monooxygenase auxiliary activity family 9 protein n=1 Tax=Streptomyces aurantiacus TaxID=47760 RepID=UPI002791D52F|nr:lytic polysaccharide monooxygenase [Streptomyces aurantiacus]MDQ0772610.1 putative carbohydrate-binding protein with CBM5 and CBM33 domain [Streptomyces aurantiacus]